jgi:hypothetical protein
MTGKEMLEKLQTFSEESLNQEVYILGADCIVNSVSGLCVSDEDYTDEDGYTIPAGAIRVDW